MRPTQVLRGLYSRSNRRGPRTNDARPISTAAQETKSPQHDVPIGIIRSLLVCTVLFIAYSFVLTGVVNYRELNVAAPLALALERIPHPGLGLP